MVPTLPTVFPLRVDDDVDPLLRGQAVHLKIAMLSAGLLFAGSAVAQCPSSWTRAVPVRDVSGRFWYVQSSTWAEVNGRLAVVGIAAAAFTGAAEARDSNVVILLFDSAGRATALRLPTGRAFPIAPRLVSSDRQTLDVVWGEGGDTLSGAGSYASRLLWSRLRSGRWRLPELVGGAARFGWNAFQSGDVFAGGRLLTVVDVSRLDDGRAELRRYDYAGSSWSMSSIMLPRYFGASFSVRGRSRDLHTVVLGSLPSVKPRGEPSKVLSLHWSPDRHASPVLRGVYDGRAGPARFVRIFRPTRDSTPTVAWVAGTDREPPADVLQIARLSGDSSVVLHSAPLRAQTLALLAPVSRGQSTLVGAALGSGILALWSIRDGRIARCDSPDVDIRLGAWLARMGRRVFLFAGASDAVEAGRPVFSTSVLMATW